MNRTKKIEQGIVKKWEAGRSFFWTEIEMINGDELYLQNIFHSTGDSLHTAAINLKVNGEWKLSKASLAEVAAYINENY